MTIRDFGWWDHLRSRGQSPNTEVTNSTVEVSAPALSQGTLRFTEEAYDRRRREAEEEAWRASHTYAGYTQGVEPSFSQSIQNDLMAYSYRGQRISREMYERLIAESRMRNPQDLNRFFTENIGGYPVEPIGQNNLCQEIVQPTIEVKTYPFNISRALEGDAVILKDGSQVTQMYLFELNPMINHSHRVDHPLVALANGRPSWFSIDGRSQEGIGDLFMKYEKTEDEFG